jgi:hypothetical protein
LIPSNGDFAGRIAIKNGDEPLLPLPNVRHLGELLFTKDKTKEVGSTITELIFPKVGLMKVA